MPSKGTSSRGGNSQRNRPTSDRPPLLPLERKEFDQVEIGQVILGPTPGVREINERIGFLYTNSERDGRASHDQIVLEKDYRGGKLTTVMVTTLGMMGIDSEKSFWSRYKDGSGLKYLIPIDPNTYRKEDVSKYDQPDLKIKYAKDTGSRYHDKLLRWAHVPVAYHIRPHRPDNAKNSKDEEGRTDLTEPYYLVRKGLKFDEEDCAKVLEYVSQREAEVNIPQQGQGSSQATKQPENTDEGKAGDEEGEEDPGWTQVVNKRSSERKKGKGKHGR